MFFFSKLEHSTTRPYKVKQFHYTSWPDHGVPEYATSMLSFHKRVISQHRSSKGPILLHCRYVYRPGANQGSRGYDVKKEGKPNTIIVQGSR